MKRAAKKPRAKRAAPGGSHAPKGAARAGTARASLGTPLVRAPVQLEGADLADLEGHLDRLELGDGRELVFGRGEAVAYWHAPSRSFVALELERRPRLRRGQPAGKAADAVRRWTGRAARHEGELEFSDPQAWQRVGRSVVLDYTSRKWNRKPRGTRYTHDTTTRPTVYVGGTRPRVWVVRGGGFNLTTRGLVG